MDSRHRFLQSSTLLRIEKIYIKKMLSVLGGHIGLLSPHALSSQTGMYQPGRNVKVSGFEARGCSSVVAFSGSELSGPGGAF